MEHLIPQAWNSEVIFDSFLFQIIYVQDILQQFCNNILLTWLSGSCSNVAQLTVHLRWAGTVSVGFPLPVGTEPGME